MNTRFLSIIYLFILQYLFLFGTGTRSTKTGFPVTGRRRMNETWSVDGGNNFRWNLMRYIPPSRPLEKGRVLTVPVFSDISTDIALNTPSIPLLSNGSIYWLDKHCNLLILSLPNQEEEGSSRRPEWQIMANFSQTAAPYPEYVPCTQIIYDEINATLYYGNRYSSTVNAIDVLTNNPSHRTYSPVQIPSEQTFQLLTHHSLYHTQSNVWFPLRYEYGVLRLDTTNGDYYRLLFPTTGALPPLLGGSTGLPAFTPGNEDNGGVVFTVYAPPDEISSLNSKDSLLPSSLIAVNSSGDIVWELNRSLIPYTNYARDDPVTLQIPTETTILESCIIMLQQAMVNGSEINPARIFGINSTTGTVCLQWNTNGYPLPAPYGTEMYIVGTPAVLPVSTNHNYPILYYVAGYTLVQTIIRSNGVEFNASSASLGSIATPSCTTSPVVFTDGWGIGKDIVTVGTGDGRVLVFDAYDIAKGPVYTYNLPTPSNFRSPPRVMGPFMAATSDGVLIFIVHESNPQSPSGLLSDDYSAIAMVAIVPVTSPPEQINPPNPIPPKSTGLRTAIVVILIGTAIGLTGYGFVKYYRRRRQRQLDLERSWYTSMAAFDEPATRFNEL